MVSGLDANRLKGHLEPCKKPTPKKRSCSGVAVYAALREELDLPPHSVVLPSDPAELYASLEAGEEPQETMAFVNHYRQGEVYSKTHGTLAMLFTVPANGYPYRLNDTFVHGKIERVSRAIGLPKPAAGYFGNHLIMRPKYFEAWVREGGFTARHVASGGAVLSTIPGTPAAGGPGCTEWGISASRRWDTCGVGRSAHLDQEAARSPEQPIDYKPFQKP